MKGIKDTIAIFEQYRSVLKEQNENQMELNQIIDTLLLLIQKDPAKSIQGKDLTKLVRFLSQPKMLESYKSFQVQPMKEYDTPNVDADTVNMGKGGTLELKAGQKFTPGQLRN